MVNGLKLLHQLNITDVSVTCFVINIPSSWVKYVRLKPIANYKILLSTFCCIQWARFLCPLYVNKYTGYHRRNGPNFGRVFLMLNYTDITQNTYIQSWTVTEIMAREKCGHLAFPRTVHLQLCSALTVIEQCGTHFCDGTSSAQRNKIAFHYCRYVQCLVTLRKPWHECECFCSSI